MLGELCLSQQKINFEILYDQWVLKIFSYANWVCQKCNTEENIFHSIYFCWISKDLDFSVTHWKDGGHRWIEINWIYIFVRFVGNGERFCISHHSGKMLGLCCIVEILGKSKGCPKKIPPSCCNCLNLEGIFWET